MKICSFLPSGTEIACLLDLEKELVAVTHECDYPASVRALPRVVTSRVDPKKFSPSEIESLVSEIMSKGESLYQINEDILAELKPDLIITQDLCQVCAPSGNEASQVLKKLPTSTKILFLTPKSINGIFDNVLETGRATGREGLATEKVAGFKKRIDSVAALVKDLAPTKTFLMEWIDPPYCSGHWLPEMLEIAGGTDPLGMKGVDSKTIAWERIIEADPDVLVVTPCGYDLNGTKKSAEQLLPMKPNLKNMKAFKNKRIFAVDANSYFVRPAPRVVEGIEILAEILHPERCSGLAPKGSYARVQID